VAGATRVAVVSQSFARHFWGKEEVIGRQFETPQGQTTVVGVAVDVHQFGQGQAPGLHLYRAFLQDPLPFARLAVRTRTAPETLAASLRREILAIDAGIPLHDIATMKERLAESVAERRFHLLLLGLFALVALALSGVGLYGVLVYAVTERTQEIGVRLALGAQRGGVLALVVRQGLTMVAAGIAVGLPASVAAARLLSGSLFGIPATDPLTLAAIPLLLLAVALLSSWLPARRATRVSPMVALRND
jgi:putative ABC transport system permease protein